jgi:long-chain acyl-CoA synthetase
MFATFAVLQLGATIVNINPLYTPREILVVAKDSRMKVLLTLDGLAQRALDARPDTQIATVIVTSLDEYSPAARPADPLQGAVSLAALLADAARSAGPTVSNVRIAPEDVAVLQYTSGTTGGPKGVMLTHHNIFANVVQVEALFRPSIRFGEERYLMVIPYFHVYGFTVGLMAGVWRGAQQIMIPKYDVEAVLSAIRDYQPTYFPAVPTIYISLLNHPRSQEHGIDRIRSFQCGSAPLPVEVIDQFERLTRGSLNEGYGLSEASPVTHSTPWLSRRKPGSIGLPLSDTDIKIVDLDTGTVEVPVGHEGELCIAGPQVMKGYWKRPEETAAALRPDAAGRIWLYTGDVARMDEDGYTYIIQRKTDMIIVSGFNVYPSEVEGVLYTHPAVSQAAVLGIPDAYRGEAVKAYAVLKDGATATPSELIAHCKDQLAEYKVPCDVELRESLPKTAAGKILYRELRAKNR